MLRALALLAVVACVTAQEILFDFGASHGDTMLHRNDDGYSSAISISIAFPFFGQSYSTLYVSDVTQRKQTSVRSMSLCLAGVHQWNHLVWKWNFIVHPHTVPHCVVPSHCSILGRR